MSKNKEELLADLVKFVEISQKIKDLEREKDLLKFSVVELLRELGEVETEEYFIKLTERATYSYGADIRQKEDEIKSLKKLAIVSGKAILESSNIYPITRFKKFDIDF